MPGHEFDPERLRPAEHLHEPDPRNALTVWCDTTTGFTRQLQAKDLHDAVAGFSLDPAVPENIAQHFETVKNLFLYSWFIYRFQPIAELEVWHVSNTHYGTDLRTRSKRESSGRRDRDCRSCCGMPLKISW